MEQLLLILDNFVVVKWFNILEILPLSSILRLVIVLMICWCLQLQAVAGLAADGRQIVARAKSEASNYERFALFSRMFKYGHISLSIISFISLFSYWSFFIDLPNGYNVNVCNN